MIEDKLERLRAILTEMESVVVAYSGGVDSTLVLQVAHEVLDARTVALTAVSPSLPSAEREEAEDIARQIGAKHVLVYTDEMQDVHYLKNTPQRCYFCKTETYDHLLSYAQENGFRCVVDGTNADDTGDHRPGRRAGLEHGVRSPLLEAGLTKADIRQLAQRFGLPNWNKPAAACLSSRIPYGSLITVEALGQIEAAERVLRTLGFSQLRVRHHDQLARIEVELDDFQAVLDQRETIIAALKDCGYTFVTLDLAGFRSGSQNEALQLALQHR